MTIEVKVHKAEIIEFYPKPGTILAVSPEGIDVQTGDGVLRLLELQFPGGKVLPVSELLKSKKYSKYFEVGKVLP